MRPDRLNALIRSKLAACDFNAVIGLFESEWLDAKETPHHLDAAPQKRELAKDVTALANAGGGLIVLGFDCEKLPMTAGERINKVCPFPVSLVEPKRYNQILADLVHPPPHGVSVLIFENAAEDGNGVAAIVIDKSVMTEGPYLVGKMVDENDLNIGLYLGYFERKRDFIPPVSIARIQQQLSAGVQWASIQNRLSAMETKIDALTPSRKVPPNTTTILRPKRDMRIKQACITVGRDDAPRAPLSEPLPHWIDPACAVWRYARPATTWFELDKAKTAARPPFVIWIVTGIAACPLTERAIVAEQFPCTVYVPVSV